MSLYNMKTERGLFINRSMKEREVLLNILLDPTQKIQLRHHRNGQERDKNWQDWRAFTEIETRIQSILASPKVPYSYALGRYNREQEKEYRSVYSYKGFLPLEEVFLLYAHHKEPKDRCFIRAPKSERWMSVYQYLNPELPKTTKIDGLPYIGLDSLCKNIVGDDVLAIQKSMHVIKDFFDLLIQELKEKKRIQFSKLGTFSLRTQPARTIPKRSSKSKVIVVPESDFLSFTPCKALKELLKKDGEEAPSKLHFGGDKQPSVAALLWAKQRGTLSTRRRFAKELATKRDYPIPFVSKVVQGLLQTLGECMARDVVLSLPGIVTMYTQWWSGYQGAPIEDHSRRVPNHRRVLFDLEKPFIKRNNLTRYPLYNPLDLDLRFSSKPKKRAYERYRILDLAIKIPSGSMETKIQFFNEYPSIASKIREFATDPTVNADPTLRKLDIIEEEIKRFNVQRDIYDMTHTDIMKGFVRVEPGTFLMGEEQVEVTLTRPFWVMKYALPHYLYNYVCNGKAKFTQEGTHSLEHIDAIRFCNTLSQKYNLEPVYIILEAEDDVTFIDYNTNANGFRLLTDAEWEYCARAGEDTLYAGSDDHKEVAITGVHYWEDGEWEVDRSLGLMALIQSFGYNTPNVGTKKPNAWGLYDMSGLFMEWVFDSYTELSSGTDPVYYDPHDDAKALRNGSYWQTPNLSQITNRFAVEEGGNLISFRIARNA